MTERERKPPRIVAYDAQPIDGICSGCSSSKDVTVLKVESFYGNMSESTRFCQECLTMVKEALFKSPHTEEVTLARNLLARIHRDGGHHLAANGLDSYKEAEKTVARLIGSIGAVPSDDLLYTLELIQDYCKDVRSGSYRVEPGEQPLQRIGDIINIGKSGSLRRPKEEPSGK